MRYVDAGAKDEISVAARMALGQRGRQGKKVFHRLSEPRADGNQADEEDIRRDRQ